MAKTKKQVQEAQDKTDAENRIFFLYEFSAPRTAEVRFLTKPTLVMGSLSTSSRSAS